MKDEGWGMRRQGGGARREGGGGIGFALLRMTYFVGTNDAMQSTPPASDLTAVPTTIRCGGRVLAVADVPVMAILNLTPDSFYGGSRVAAGDDVALLGRAEQLLADGASFLDVGGYSTRPGAAEVPVEEELARVVPAMTALRRAFPGALLSVDTFRAAVAAAALDAGADVVNDVSGGLADPAMLTTVGRYPGVPYVLMHMRGTPQTMSHLTDYAGEGGLLVALTDFFSRQVAAARAAGIGDILLDPGFGFAKTMEQNYALLSRLPDLKAVLRLPLLVGVSRKGMTYRPLGIGAAEALPATTALHGLAVWHGADVLRVHDPREARQAVAVARLARGAAGG